MDEQILEVEVQNQRLPMMLWLRLQVLQLQKLRALPV